MVRRALAQAGGTLSLTDTLTLIERIREHEKMQPLAARGPWQASRASAHLVLARRGSRIALYDLRETVERAKEPIALEFLAASTRSAMRHASRRWRKPMRRPAIGGGAATSCRRFGRLSTAPD
jgi:hypothetical protein